MKLGIRNYLIVRRFPPDRNVFGADLDRYCVVMWRSSEDVRNKIRQDYYAIDHILTQKVY